MTQEVAAQRRLLAELALVGICAVWGLTFPMVQDAVAVFPVMTFLAYRFIAAAAIVGIVFAPQLRDLAAAGWRGGALMGVFLTGGYVFQTFGLDLTTAAHAGFITGLFVVLTPLLGALLFGQVIGGRAWAAAAASTVGLLLLSGLGGEGNVTGDLLVLVCACSFALHILVTDRVVREHHVGALLVVQLTVCGLFSLAAAVSLDQLAWPSAPDVWRALAVTSLLATAVGFFVQSYAQLYASPARTALILTTEPVFAGLFAYLLKGQTLTLPGWAGAVLIMAAIVGVEVVPHLRTPRLVPPA